MTTNDATEPVVADGSVERVTDRGRIVGFVPAYEEKYGPSQGLDFFLANAAFRFQPSVVFGMVEAAFTTSPTRWTC